MERTSSAAPHAAHSTPTPRQIRPLGRLPAAGRQPAAAVLAALPARPGGATVTVIAGQAGVSTATARQALLAHEKTGAATRVKGSRPGLPDTRRGRPACLRGVSRTGDRLVIA